MVVNNVTKISATQAYKLLEKSGKKSQLMKIVIALLLIGSGLFILIDGIITKDSTFISMGCLFTAIGIGYLVMALLNLARMKKLIFKNNEDICTYGVRYIFKFKEQSIQITTETNNKSSKIEYKYDNVKNL